MENVDMAEWTGCIIVSDHDRKFISVHGPMTDDTEINRMVCEAQETGRNINCCSGDENFQKATAEAHEIQPDYQLVDDALQG